PQVTLPDLTGQDPKVAADTLTKLGLTPAIDPTPVTSTRPLGTIERTDPPAGTKLYAGSVVKIFLSNGVPPPPAPPPPGSAPPDRSPGPDKSPGPKKSPEPSPTP